MKDSILKDIFSKMVPFGNYCSFKDRGEFSVVTVEEIEGPLPLNTTAAEILDLCDGQKTVMDICNILQQKYNNISNIKIFNDLITCIRNLEVISVIKIKYL